MPYTYLLFDADHTLLDFDQSEAEAITAVLTENDIVANTNTIDFYNTVNKAYWQKLAKGEITLDELRYKRFEEFLSELGHRGDAVAFGQRYLELLSKDVYWLEDAREILEELAKDYTLVCITNGLKEVQRPRFDKAGFYEIFTHVIISDEIGVSKPDQAYFNYTLNQMGNPQKEEVLVVGDNILSDIMGAFRVGLDACWYNPKQEERPYHIRPTFEINRLNELLAILHHGGKE